METRRERKQRKVTRTQGSKHSPSLQTPLAKAKPSHQISPREEPSGQDPWVHRWLQLRSCFFPSSATQCAHTEACAESIAEIICSVFIYLFISFLSVFKTLVCVAAAGLQSQGLRGSFLLQQLCVALAGSNPGLGLLKAEPVGMAWTPVSAGWRAMRPTPAATLLADWL